MQFDIRPRRGGKTYSAVLACGFNPNAVIVVPTRIMADNLKREYPNLRCGVIAWSERQQAQLGVWTDGVIDNADLILAMELGRINVRRATASLE